MINTEKIIPTLVESCRNVQEIATEKIQELFDKRGWALAKISMPLPIAPTQQHYVQILSDRIRVDDLADACGGDSGKWKAFFEDFQGRHVEEIVSAFAGLQFKDSKRKTIHYIDTVCRVQLLTGAALPDNELTECVQVKMDLQLFQFFPVHYKIKFERVPE